MDSEVFINKVNSEIGETKILRSVCIAMAILETGWGTNELYKVNNIYSLNCYDEKLTEQYNDNFIFVNAPQEYNGKTTYSTEKFFAFKDFREATECLMLWFTRPKYDGIFKIKDYKELCKHIHKCGYATSSKYSDSLIRIIEQYNLTMFDNEQKKPTKTMYCLQVGAYEHIENAKNEQLRLKRMGIDTYIFEKEI